MRRLIIATTVLLTVTGCTTSPTGRKQLLIIPEAQMAAMGAQAFAEIRSSTPTIRDRGARRYVQCIARSIVAQTPGQSNWEVEVFQDDSANAFALPGGKIGVHTGMLKLTQNQGQLAAVMAHEVAHVLAQHSNARASLHYAADAALQLASAATGDFAARQQLFGLLGIGAQYGVLMPYGRDQEREADILGLELMARAGFDPRESVELWRRMAAASQGQPPEFLSTHPSHGHRIEALAGRMDDALALYSHAQSEGIRPSCR